MYNLINRVLEFDKTSDTSFKAMAADLIRY
jgi:hypothetical protein